MDLEELKYENEKLNKAVSEIFSSALLRFVRRRERYDELSKRQKYLNWIEALAAGVYLFFIGSILDKLGIGWFLFTLLMFVLIGVVCTMLRHQLEDMAWIVDDARQTLKYLSIQLGISEDELMKQIKEYEKRHTGLGLGFPVRRV